MRPALDLDETGRPATPAAFVVLDDIDPRSLRDTLDSAGVVVGVVRRGSLERLDQALAAVDCTVIERSDRSLPRTCVAVDGIDSAISRIQAVTSAAPVASATLTRILRIEAQTVRHGLLIESLAYSTLLAGGEFAEWRSSSPSRPSSAVASCVSIVRERDELVITLNRPERRNAYSRDMRDGLVEALNIALVDSSVARVILRGAGPSFCSGGDLDEFGTTDVAVGNLIRTARSAGELVEQLHERVICDLHGACIGAGIEIPAFAGRIRAANDTRIQLPELAMGLIPGAGGTVSLPRRIGRWRTAYLALTSESIDARAALSWGLVDELV